MEATVSTEKEGTALRAKCFFAVGNMDKCDYSYSYYVLDDFIMIFHFIYKPAPMSGCSRTRRKNRRFYLGLASCCEQKKVLLDVALTKPEFRKDFRVPQCLGKLRLKANFDHMPGY
jgi:hypothetical protein